MATKGKTKSTKKNKGKGGFNEDRIKQRINESEKSHGGHWYLKDIEEGGQFKTKEHDNFIRICPPPQPPLRMGFVAIWVKV